MPTTNRLNVSLLNDDGDLLEELRLALEKRLAKRLSLAEVVRIALHTQANNEGIKNENQSR